MSEITKLYENAGLSNMWVQRYNDGYYDHERHYNSYKEMINNMMKANDWTLTEAQEVAKRECRKEHPPFTAEKQIELIKWLIDTDYFITEFCRLIDTREYYIETNYKHFQSSGFEETLAGLINNLWLSLTSEEKQQVKGILE